MALDAVHGGKRVSRLRTRRTAQPDLCSAVSRTTITCGCDSAAAEVSTALRTKEWSMPLENLLVHMRSWIAS